MADAHPPLDPDEPPSQLSATPFLVALVLFVIVAAWAVVNLRDDAGLELLAPDGFELVDDDSFRTVGELADGGCAELERVQVDLGEERIFAELVVRRIDDCASPTIVATVTLPEAIGDRRLVAGAGRFQLPCERGSASDGWICADR